MHSDDDIQKNIIIFVAQYLAIHGMKYSELEKKLKPQGCKWHENGSNHPIWISEITGNKFAMSYHRSEEVKPGTLNSILKISGAKI